MTEYSADKLNKNQNLFDIELVQALGESFKSDSINSSDLSKVVLIDWHS
ncbi:hypothetical protein SAMN04488137_4517 [Fictibacillus solisalsi]|uniref:Uncharacterized protein n=1 Tax=Fictibacillus solisalsi TaxID=459525 RepID=A0A1H0BJE7_9BACL|nr:hypothetical protein SAMN04488137_4517 [Fictibacillus solisalsi]